MTLLLRCLLVILVVCSCSAIDSSAWDYNKERGFTDCESLTSESKCTADSSCSWRESAAVGDSCMDAKDLPAILEHNNYLMQTVLPPGHTWAEFYSRGLLGLGNITSSLARKFQAHQPLVITAMGGSITCGATLNDRRGGRYATQLNNLLEEKYQNNFGSGSNVNKINVHCGSGETTESWVDLLLRNSNNPSHPLIVDLLMSDIVILDTAVNDIEEVNTGWRDQNHFMKQLELLIVNLLAYPRLNIVVAGTCTREGPWDGRVETRHGDSLLSYITLCKKYGIAVISVVDGLGDLATNIDTRAWWLDKFTSSIDLHTHPTKLGHTLIAHLLLELIMIQSKSNYQYLRLSDNGENAPLYWDSYEILNANIMVRPVTIDLLHYRAMLKNAFVRLSGDWGIYEDIKGRPGFISTSIGSSSSFYLPAAMTKNLTQWIVHIDALKSYEHMSCLVVRYRVGEIGQVHSVIFNMKWEARVSEHSILELDLNRTGSSVGSHSLSILLEIVNSYCNDTSNNNTNREINKIKAFAITIY